MNIWTHEKSTKIEWGSIEFKLLISLLFKHSWKINEICLNRWHLKQKLWTEMNIRTKQKWLHHAICNQQKW